MVQTETTLQSVLKASGYSITNQRQTVFDLLVNQEPLSMRELCQRAARTMDRASVYRTVALFERLGIVRRINIGWKYRLELSDIFSEHHHHMTCLKCKRIIQINAQALEKFIDTLASSAQFSPTEHQIEIQGYCAACIVAKSYGKRDYPSNN
jgi:Fur family ferric uptake transcriptional regulator